ncbi:MAG: PIN domain-containing protein [Lysobacterales bacterium]|nr:MAG: PIN domain-containing protein [Xanthomonadales bacterium]
MMYETDILIRIQRGHARAELKLVKDFVFTFDFAVLPLSENIGHRALVYIEEYTLSAGLRSADALIAATAVEQNLELVTSNARHFRAIRDLQLKPFRP